MRILLSFLPRGIERRSALKLLTSLTLGIGVLVLGATPALANHVTNATAMTTCTSYVIEVNAAALTSGASYTISYTITLKPGTGASTVVTGSIPFKGTSTGTFTDTITKQINLITDNYTLTGTATLVGHNSVPVSFSPNTLACICPD